MLEPSNRKWWLRDRHKTLSFLAAQGERLRGPLGGAVHAEFRRQDGAPLGRGDHCEARPAGDGWEVALGLDAGPAGEAAVRDAVAAGRGLRRGGGPASSSSTRRGSGAWARPSARWPTGPAARPVRAPDRADQRRAGQRGRGAARGAFAGLQAARRNGGAHARPAQPLAPRAGADPGGLRRRAAALPAPRRRLAVAPSPERPRRGSRRRDGPRQDAPGAGPPLRGPRRRRDKPRRLPRLAGRELAARGGPLRARTCGSSSTRGESRLAGAGRPRALRPRDHLLWDARPRPRAASRQVEFACVIGDEAQHVKNRRSQNAQALRSAEGQGPLPPHRHPGRKLARRPSLALRLHPSRLPRAGPAGRPRRGAGLVRRAAARQDRPLHPAAHQARRRARAAGPDRAGGLVHARARPGGPLPVLSGEVRAGAARPRGLRRKRGQPAPGGPHPAPSPAPDLLRPAPGLRAGGCGAGGYEGSAKLESFREILAEAADDGHRILVFSQFTSLLALLRGGARFPGDRRTATSTDRWRPRRARPRSTASSRSGAAPVFLLSLKAGGSGPQPDRRRHGRAL